jgi:hypothetical protein
MNLNPVLQTFMASSFGRRLRGMFNLNDSRWGREEGGSASAGLSRAASFGCAAAPASAPGLDSGPA